ncbi:MAG: DUF4062 domain-containing protein [Candidatus Methanoperedens sp.]|nr:DUF4062 domain-containing protein [Candidatus Methanoperedens sp.]
MPLTSRTFRIFVSSTFSDLKEERNALQKNVFPKLRELCMQHGCRFQAIDLRWGVREESALDQQTMKICYEEIARCQRVTPRPNFIVLLGDRYGWRPLPYEIPADEFMEIEQKVSDTDRDLLKIWFRRDDNAVPPVYCLQPRTGEFTDYTKWEFVERRLHSILLQATADMKLTADSYAKYFASATEQEIIRGLKTQDDGEHVFGFFRSIKDFPHSPSAKEFIDLNEMGNLNRDANKYLNDLKDKLRKLLPGNIYEYEAEWTGSGTTAEHIDILCRDVYDSLSSIIQKEVAELEEVDVLDKEIADHNAFGRERAKFFIGRAAVLQKIDEYVKRRDPHPFAIFGTSGSGKSALIAQATEQARNDHPNAKIILRLIGATPSSTDIQFLLKSLCQQIYNEFGLEEQKLQQLDEIKGFDEYAKKKRQQIEEEYAIPSEMQKLAETFQRFLTKVSSDTELIIFLDALDRLSEIGHTENLSWLPPKLPENVHLVVSTLSGESLLRLLPPQNFMELKLMPTEEGDRLLNLWLEDAGRTLQPHQRDEVCGKFEQCGLPLYLKLAFEEARKWKSYSEKTELSPDVLGEIRDMFRRFSSDANHGKILVSRSMGFLVAAKNGLTEDELLDLLSLDDEVFQEFIQRAYHKPPEKKLPAVVWSRLYFDLEPYLIERAADDTTLMIFYHRQMNEVAAEEFLAGEVKRKRHEELARYFGNQPLWIEKNSKKTANIRKLSELPYQQTNGELWDEIEQTLGDLDFIEEKCTAGMTYDLLAEYNVLSRVQERAKGKLGIIESFARFVRARSHVLIQRPNLLLQEAYNFAESGISRRAKELLNDLRRTRRPWLKLLNSSNESSDLCLQTLEGHNYKVNAMAVTLDGRQVITGSDDCTVRIWDLETKRCLRILEGQKEVKALVITSDGCCAITGSYEEIKVWDLESGEILRTLNQEGNVKAMAITPDCSRVIAVSSNKIKVWDLETGDCLKTLEGHTNFVNAVAITPDGRFVITGSDDKTIKIWDLAMGTCLRTMEGNESRVEVVAVTPDGHFAISGSFGTFKVWNIETGKYIKTLKMLIYNVKAMVVTPDGQYLVISNYNNVNVWNLETGECLKTLEGHTDFVNAVTVTSDGRFAITGSSDKTIKIWDLEIKASFNSMERHTEVIRSVAITPDGQWAVTGSNDMTVKIWDLESGTYLKTLEGHIEIVTAVAVTYDSLRAVTGGVDNTVRIWDLITGECIKTLRGHTSFINSVAITPDDRFVITGSYDKTAMIWEMGTGKCIKTLEGHKEEIDAVAVTPDGLFVITGSSDRTVKIWEIGTGKCIKTLDGHKEGIAAVAITPDGRFAITGSNDKTIKVWEIDTGECLKTLEGHIDFVNAVAVTPDSCFVITGSDDKTIKIWDLATGTCLRTMEGHEGGVRAVAITPDGRFALTGSYKTVKVWDLETGACINTLNGDIYQILAMAVTKDGHWAVTGGDENGSVKIWNLESGAYLKTLEVHTEIVTAVAVTYDSLRAVTGGVDNTVRIWDLITGECTKTLRGHTSFINSVAITPDDCFLITGSDDKTIKVWEMGTGKCLNTLEGHKEGVAAVAITPDGRFAITGSNDKTIKVWEIETGECLNTLEGHKEGVTAVAVTPDSRFAITGSNDKTVKVWEIETGECLNMLEGHKEGVAALAITPDGRRIVTGGHGLSYPLAGEVKIWDLEYLEWAVCINTMEGHEGGVQAVAVTPDSRFAITGSFGTVKVWDLETGACINTLKGDKIKVKAISVTKDGHWAVTGGDENGSVKVWDLESGAYLKTLEGHRNRINKVAITPDGYHAITGSQDGAVKIWDLKFGVHLKSLGSTGGPLYESAVAITSDSHRALTTHRDSTGSFGIVKVWDIKTGTCIKTLEGNEFNFEAVTVTKDGRWAVTGSGEGTVKVWNMETGTCLKTEEEFTGSVPSIVIMPDDRRVILGEVKGSVKVLDLETGMLLKILKIEDGVNQIAVTPDGRQAIIGGRETVKVWDLEKDICLLLEGHKKSVCSVSISSDGRFAVTGSEDNTVRVWDLATRKELACHFYDSSISKLVVSYEGTLIAAGDQSGGVHFLKIENLAPSSMVLTAWCSPVEGSNAYLCPLCRTWSEIPASAIGSEIPCFHCRKPIKLNSFTINVDWRPVAKAWRGGKDKSLFQTVPLVFPCMISTS